MAKKRPSATSTFRYYKRLLEALDLLRSVGIVGRDGYDIYLKRCDQLYQEIKNWRRGAWKDTALPVYNDVEKRYHHILTKCKNRNCSNPPAKGQSYCSKACAPCGLIPTESHS